MRYIGRTEDAAHALNQFAEVIPGYRFRAVDRERYHRLEIVHGRKWKVLFYVSPNTGHLYRKWDTIDQTLSQPVGLRITDLSAVSLKHTLGIQKVLEAING